MTAPELAPVLDGADYVEFKEIDGDVSLREFAANAFAWQPRWVKGLFAVRMVLARALRLDTAEVPRRKPLRPEDVGFEPGDALAFFTVHSGDPERFLVAGADDKHLKAYVTVTAEPLDGGRRRFRVGTIVHFHNRTGSRYFALIKPFHHLIMRGMLKAGAARPA